MSEDLKNRLEECQVGIASRGQRQPDGSYLSPHLWESLRQRLQSIYRQATGEAAAVLSDEPPATAEKPFEEEYYARGYGLRCAVIGFLNGAYDKDELRRRFVDWEGCSGTRFALSPAEKAAALESKRP